MRDVKPRNVPASVQETAFSCPHCSALAKQFWHSVFAVESGKDSTPIITVITPELEASINKVEEHKEREEIWTYVRRRASGITFLHKGKEVYSRMVVENLFVSRCFNCDEIAIWLYDQLLWPTQGDGPAPHPDLPSDIRRDYDEASAILQRSPRGAAALLRLVIQKICIYLEEPGENLNEDIGALVERGLPVRIQRALDTVRVIGAQAVHPLEMDLRDDRATAESLFMLVNLIVEEMIAKHKQIDELYRKLPPTKIEQIVRRDTPKIAVGKKDDKEGR